MAEPFVYPRNAAERDLERLISERVEQAMQSVIQLATDNHQTMLLAQSANMVTLGVAAAAYWKFTGKARDVTTKTGLNNLLIEYAEVLLRDLKATASRE